MRSIQLSWTAALRSIVLSCYRHHDREDLLPDFREGMSSQYLQTQTLVQAINNPDGTVSLIQIYTGNESSSPQIVTLADGTQARILQTMSKVPSSITFRVREQKKINNITFVALIIGHHLETRMSCINPLDVRSRYGARSLYTDGTVYQRQAPEVGMQTLFSNATGTGIPKS